VNGISSGKIHVSKVEVTTLHAFGRGGGGSRGKHALGGEGGGGLMPGDKCRIQLNLVQSTELLNVVERTGQFNFGSAGCVSAIPKLILACFTAELEANSQA